MRILIVSPKFAPANAADLHRVRILLPHWVNLGVEIEVLSLAPEQIPGDPDPWLAQGIPASVTVHRVRAPEGRRASLLSLGRLEFRILRTLQKAGEQILAAKPFDLIYFSTTMFEVHTIALHWQRRFNVPFVMDYQDPWVNDYYRENRQAVPPGGRIKYGILDFLYRRMEPAVLKSCAGITAVSPAYPQQLARRYPWTAQMPHFVQPFPGDEQDLQRARLEKVPQSVFSRNEGVIHWVYAGMTNPGMDKTITAFFRSLADHAPENIKQRLRIHFLGTCYGGKPDSPPVVKPLAEQFGLSGLVNERPERIRYSEVLACLRDADALLIFGSNDTSYTASKIYPYLLSGKPLLTIFHQDSSVVSLISRVGGSICIPFANEDSEHALSQRIAEGWLRETRFQQIVPLDRVAFEPYTAKNAARGILTFFESIIA